MMTTYRSATDDALFRHLEAAARPRLDTALRAAGKGQRLRVTALPAAVMVRLARAYASHPSACVRVLGESAGVEAEIATATKIIEFRNTWPGPVLVFVPDGLRVAAEDSLDIATFAEIAFDGLTEQALQLCLNQLPIAAREVLSIVERRRRPAPTPDEKLRYAADALESGNDSSIGLGLFRFGLIPDSGLHLSSEREADITRNVDASKRLSDGAAPIQTRISQLRVTAGTIQPLLYQYLRTHAGLGREWARDIALEPTMRPLDFREWKFVDTGSAKDLRLVMQPLKLPRTEDEAKTGSVGMPVFDTGSGGGRPKLALSFRAFPKPAEVPEWKNYRFLLLRMGGGESTVVLETGRWARPNIRGELVTRTLTADDLDSLDEGTYFARVEAYSADGAVLNAKPNHVGDGHSRAENESEPFLYLKGENVEKEDLPTRSYPVPSLASAWASALARWGSAKSRSDDEPAMSHARGGWTDPVGAAPRGDVRFELSGESFQSFAIVMPGWLRRIERTILEQGAAPAALRVDMARARAPVDVTLTSRGPLKLGGSPAAANFLSARKALFETISRGTTGPMDGTAEASGVVETMDMLTCGPLVDAYTQAWEALVADAAGRGDAALLTELAVLDEVEVRWAAGPNDPGYCLLLGPTHPVRMAWHRAHASLTRSLVDACRVGGDRADWKRLFERLSNHVLPVALPLVIFDRRNRGYVEQGLITTHWALYAPDTRAGLQVDAATVRTRVLDGLGIRDKGTQVPVVDPHDLATRLSDYLKSHPHVDELRLNTIGAGDGQLIADVLQELDAKRRSERGTASSGLRYRVDVFAPRDLVDTAAVGLEALVDPNRQVGEDDEFTVAGESALRPKLIFGTAPFEALTEKPGRHAAHVTFLIEPFPSRTRIGDASRFRQTGKLAGLAQEPESLPEQSPGEWTFVRGANPSPETSVGRALAAMHRVHASAAYGKVAGENDAPQVELVLDGAAQARLALAHDTSDWVITVDRGIGLEYFDSLRSEPTSTPSDDAPERGAAPSQRVTLLDYSPDTLQEGHPRILLTTRSTFELERVMTPALSEYGFAVTPGAAERLIDAVRALSARLALRFDAGESQFNEMLGLVMARFFLEQEGHLKNRLVIPLDAHREWFSDPTGALPSARRADLLLVGLAETRTLRLDIIEVKMRDSLTAASRAELYASMLEQTQNTEQHLMRRFGAAPDGRLSADAMFRAKELATVLGFYAGRAGRYKLATADFVARMGGLLARLEAGYNLDVRTLGIVFERQASGLHQETELPGFTVYRAGGDWARSILARHLFGISDQSQLSRSEESAALRSVRSSLELPADRHDVAAASDVQTQPPPVVPRGEKTASVATSEGAEPSSTHVETVDGAPVKAVAEIATPGEPALASSEDATTPPPILLGSSVPTPQFGILGRYNESSVGLDLNGCNTISLFGVQGFGKSYTLGVIAEMAVAAVPGINTLPSPLATIVFHYHKSDAYEPEHAAAVGPNDKPSEVKRLLDEYRAKPTVLKDVVVLVPRDKLKQRQAEMPDVHVQPIAFSSAELGAESWKFLLGAYGNNALYIQQIVQIMRRQRSTLTLASLKSGIEDAELNKSARQLAEDRIRLAEQYIDDSCPLGAVLRPGRTVIVDLRDEWVEKDEALGLFVVMLRIFSAQKHKGKEFNKLVVFDEAHKYITESDLIGQVVETIREMRHQATSVVIASQDPLSVPRAVIELSTILVLHRMTSPAWLKHLRTAIAALEDVSDATLRALQPGEALVWAQRSTDARFTQRPQRVVIRPRFTAHGGGTKTAVSGVSMR